MKATARPPVRTAGPGAQASPLMWWTGSQLAALAAHFRKVWAAWAHDWAGDSVPPAEASAIAAHEWSGRECARWALFGSRGQISAWIDLRADPVSVVHQALFGEEVSPARHDSGAEGIAQGLATRAWNALAHALRSALEVDAQARREDPHSTSFRPWSGAAVVSLSFGGRLPIAILLDAACLRRMPVLDESLAAAGGRFDTFRPPLVPLVHAFAGRLLPLQVELASCELDLGSLESLAIGDVVPLPHHLDAPLLVSAEPGVPVCAGFLGRKSGFKAIELARVAADDPLAQSNHQTLRDALNI